MKKRLLSILTVLALCLSLMPVTALPAFAEGETYRVAGVAELCGSTWDAADDNNLMTLNADTGLYEIFLVGTNDVIHPNLNDSYWNLIIRFKPFK